MREHLFHEMFWNNRGFVHPSEKRY